jgi:excisionase family DNA binding protein
MSNSISNDIRMYTVAEVAKIMGVSPGKVYELIHEGKLPRVQIGKMRVLHNTLAAFLQSQETSTLWGED